MSYSPYFPDESKRKQQKNEKEKERRDRENELIADLRNFLVKNDQEATKNSRMEKLDVLRSVHQVCEKQKQVILQQQQALARYHGFVVHQTAVIEQLKLENERLQRENREMQEEDKENIDVVTPSTPVKKTLAQIFSSPDSGFGSPPSLNISLSMNSPSTSTNLWKPYSS